MYNRQTNSIASPLIQIILSIALATITWFAIDASVITKMSSGTFIAFFGAAAMLAKPIRQLSITNSMIQRGLAAAEVIFNQIDEKDEDLTINKIKEVLDTKIRPAVSKDGGDIKFVSFKKGTVTVELRGSCSGCPSSTMTLKQGVQNPLCHYLPEVKSVEAI